MPENNILTFFDSYAQDFDAIYGSKNNILGRFINKYLRKSMRLRFEKTVRGCMPVAGKSILDIGCGPGHYVILLAKLGAGRALGIDFAGNMVRLARENAKISGMEQKCIFRQGNFQEMVFDEKYDYAILMGFMEYIDSPCVVVEKVCSITAGRAFFSFPDKSGFLAWQRKMRYRWKCSLYMYDEQMIRELFSKSSFKHIEIQKIARDFFVTAYK